MVTLWFGTLFLGLYCLSNFYLLRAAVVGAIRTSGEAEASSIPQSCTPSDLSCTASDSPIIATVIEECTIWVAVSTIPGAGLGIFAGKKFGRGETLMAGGDQIIPIVDMLSHQEEVVSFLWDDYTWVSGRSDCFLLPVERHDFPISQHLDTFLCSP